MSAGISVWSNDKSKASQILVNTGRVYTSYLQRQAIIWTSIDVRAMRSSETIGVFSIRIVLLLTNNYLKITFENNIFIITSVWIITGMDEWLRNYRELVGVIRIWGPSQ